MALLSFVYLAAFASTVLADSPFIPSEISTGCTSYLQNLDGSTSFQSCLSPFLTAFQQFAPGANTSASSSSINTALQSLCQNTKCSQSSFTTALSQFYAACSTELTSQPNDIVRTTYDSLYSLFPISQAICSKDDNGKYCATEMASPQPQAQTVLSDYLYTNLNNNASLLVPNTTTYSSTNLVFLFLSSSLSSSQLCSTCTRNIITPYITFESNSPYATGLNASLLFAGQLGLYATINTECGANFLSGAVQAAGGLSGGVLSNGAPRTDHQTVSAAMGALLGIAALAAASL